MSESTEHRIESAQVRRAPRYAMFLVVGAALGVVVAIILTFAFDGTDDVSTSTQVSYSLTQVFGFLALVCITVGIALGGIVALILDRTMARRAREVRVDHEHIEVDEPEAPRAAE